MLRKRAPLFRPNISSGTAGNNNNNDKNNETLTPAELSSRACATIDTPDTLPETLPDLVPLATQDGEESRTALAIVAAHSQQSIAESQHASYVVTTSIIAQPPLVIKTSADKSKLMRDLLFHNPPLTKKQRKLRKKLSKAAAAREKKARKAAEAQCDRISENEEQDQEHSIAPQVRLSANGELVLDEQSLVIERRNKLKDKEAIIEDSDDIIGNTSYSSFRRKPVCTNRSKWLEEDTRKFYRALSICGTDFSLMETLVFKGSRSRTELKKKFKREEKSNRAKIDLALSTVISMSTGELEEVVGSLGAEV